MSKTTFIAAGDAFITRRLPESGYPGFRELQALVCNHDVSFLEMDACLPGCVWNATPRSLSPLDRNIGFWTQA